MRKWSQSPSMASLRIYLTQQQWGSACWGQARQDRWAGCSHTLWEAEAEDRLSPVVQDQYGQQSECQSLQKRNQKFSRVWWYTPVVPAIQEAEAGGSLEPKEVEATVKCLCHCTPVCGWQSETLHLKKKKTGNPHSVSVFTSVRWVQ